MLMPIYCVYHQKQTERRPIHTAVVYSFPGDTMLQFLPLVYVIPYDLLIRCPTLKKLPRSIGEIKENLDWIMGVVERDPFLVELLDAIGFLVFPHFGFRGFKEYYSVNFPMWKLSYSLPLWLEGLEKFTGWNLQAMFLMRSHQQIVFPPRERVEELFSKIAKWAIEKENWEPMMQVLREMPCEEDFEPYDTYVRRDFLRKWYHSRSKQVQTISLEECLENAGSEIHTLSSHADDFVERVEEDDYFERFKATLTPNDMKILKLRSDGYNYKEIAEKLGYQNHSGVVKRMAVIKKRFIEYENKTGS